ncbi:MAG: hypothetical protein N2645_22040 [Clostridia bacterium]|nr:hypothetical protein [Clostridia bacterium]
MLFQSSWWTCPKCKSYKMLSGTNCECVRCAYCGTYFDKNGDELDLHSVLEKPEGIYSCELN